MRADLERHVLAMLVRIDFATLLLDGMLALLLFAGALHVSGPLAAVAAGLLVGNEGRRLGMSATTREHLDTFWELIDEILNGVLFVLIGLEALVLSRRGSFLLAPGLRRFRSCSWQGW